MTHQIRIKGPFWTAVAEYQQVDEFGSRSRAVYLSPNAQDRDATTTMTVLCRVERVTIQPPGETDSAYVWIDPKNEELLDIQDQDALRDLLEKGVLSHLVLQDDRNDLSRQTYICINGEINLDRMSPSDNALGKLYAALPIDPPLTAELDDLAKRSGAAAMSGAVTVHASGVSIYGRMRLPWREAGQEIAAPFQIAQVIPGPNSNGKTGGFRVALEHERLSAAESTEISAAWMALSRMLNPRFPLNSPTLPSSTPTPRWVTLEISDPRRVPRIYWQGDTWASLASQDLPLLYERGEFTLLISDQQAYDTTTPPTSLARFLPDTVAVMRSNGGDLQISVNPARDSSGQSAQLKYGAQAQKNEQTQKVEWTENLTLAGHELAFDPVDTPRRLRQFQNRPAPEWTRTPLEPPLLWAFMPLADGWAQLPVPNLTEQIYLDAEIAQQAPETAALESAMRGAVAWGNDQPSVLEAHPGEAPWHLTLTGAQDLSGTWTLEAGELNKISLQIFEPSVVINGLLWLSTGKPRRVDALPDLDDWVAGLAAVPLRTINPQRDIFPPVITFPDFALTLSTRPAAGSVPGSAQLRSWSLHYAVNAQLVANLIAEYILPGDVFSRWPALIWRRHPHLPMIQALPLTQSQVPPNYPSASRQLIPFALPVKNEKIDEIPFDRPEAWIFTVQGENGAAMWPSLDPTTTRRIRPDANWRSEHDLPLVALTLPGIILDPQSPKMTPETDQDDEPNLPGLGLQYRFDLPYADEIHALAQLSNAAEDETTAPDDEPKPLTRELLAGHWHQLAEKANLASADAVAAFDRDGDKTVLKHLAEPFNWPVATFFDLSEYPGRFELTNAGANGDGPPPFSRDSALAGISGNFKENDGTLEFDESGPYQITAGSMAALLDDQLGIRDQRGLGRGLSQKNGATIKTPVQLDEADGSQSPYDLVSLITVQKLQFPDGIEWDLWFRDLPVTGGWFRRAMVQSAQAEDANDPQALARARNYLNGYEWRLAQAGQTDYLNLFNLHFYPLSLQAVEIVSDQVHNLEITGRLQLPMANSVEQTNYSNAVRLTFKASEDEDLTLQQVALEPRPDLSPYLPEGLVLDSEAQKLTWKGGPVSAADKDELANLPGDSGFKRAMRQLIAKIPGSAHGDGHHGSVFTVDYHPEARGDWPLSLDEEEGSKAPHLLWEVIRLDADGLQIIAPRLKFVLFDTIWTIPLEDLSFTANRSEIRSSYQFEKQGAALEPEEVALVLDLNPATHQHTVSLDLGIALGHANGQGIVPFCSRARFPILDSPEKPADVEWLAGMLFADVNNPADGAFTGGLELQGPESGAEDPGILRNGNALEFKWTNYTNPDHKIQFLPGMPLQGSQSEPGFTILTFAVTPAQGDGIPTLTLKTAFMEALLACRWPAAATDPTFDSSAGELTIGYTLNYTNDTWQPSVLLNGHLEITNFISWPLAMARDQQASDDGHFKLPAVTDDANFEHVRHSIRVLFNQQSIHSELLVIAKSADVLYTLRGGEIWQFLAVVEHRLLDVSLTPDERRNDRRWTAVQEVRFLPHPAFGAFLDGLDGLDKAAGVVDNFGYLNPTLLEMLKQETAKLPAETNLLFVEASAPHWIRQIPLTDSAPTPLQYLPGGTQLGILSSPEDYAPSDPKDPAWLLLVMPFLGRLQDDQANERNDPFLEDPVRQVMSQGASAPELTLSFSGWRQDHEIAFTVSALDRPPGRSWPRLDPGALEENWFRLQNPRDEEHLTTIQSITAARPNTPARLSRAMALRQASYAFRPAYPPAPLPAALPLPPTGEMGMDRWPQAYLPALQGVIQYKDGQGSQSFWDPSESLTGVDEGSGSSVELGLRFRSKVDGFITGLRFYKGEGITGRHTGHLYDRLAHELASAEFARGTEPGWQTVTFSKPVPIEANRSYIAAYKSSSGAFSTKHQYFIGDQKNYARGDLYVHGDNGIFRYDRNRPFSHNLRKNRNYLVDVIFEPFPFPAWHLSGAQILASTLGKVTADPSPQRYAAATLLPGPRAATGSAQEATAETITLDQETAVDVDDAYVGLQIEITDGRGEGQTAMITAYDGKSKVATVDREWSRSRPRKGSKYRLGAWPLSLAVSPYLGLDFRPASAALRLKLISAELICQDRLTGELRPVASQLWEAAEADTRQSLYPHIQRWAGETHRRLSPESAVAVLRLREINENMADPPAAQQALLTTTYDFALVKDIQASDPLVKQTFALRSAVSQLRFREGQFAGFDIPDQAQPFEIAPPQVNGVQPLYLLPDRDKAGIAADWPWGLSALRLSVQYTKRRQAVIGTAANGAAPKATLWWQTLGHFVQFREGGQGSGQPPGAGLPALFRAQAIKSLLPVLPNPPLPALQPAAMLNAGAGPHGQWQPVLPGALRYMSTGARAGVMFAMRHGLIKQSGLDLEQLAPQRGATMVSGSVPVQHRFPRPVPLCDNVQGKEETALQTWASYFEPTQTLLASEIPVDEAFFAGDGQEPAHRLQLQLATPRTIQADWDGQLQLKATSKAKVYDKEYWQINLTIGDNQTSIAYQDQGQGENDPQDARRQLYDFQLPEDEKKMLQGLLAAKRPGDLLFAKATVKKRTPDDGFTQTLSLPLRVIDPQALRLPLAPRFIHFEDPEYNRQLVSTAAQASKPVVETQKLADGSTAEFEHTITLAADRQEYNPDSVLAFRFDWADTVEWNTEKEGNKGKATYSLKATDRTGISRTVQATEEISDGYLTRLSLLDLNGTLRPGDALEIELTITPQAPSFKADEVKISLKLDIVRDPVMPISTSAYALLRQQNGPDNSPVECVRFAWGPQANRVELVNPADLRTGIVRRRAVFQWSDAVRPLGVENDEAYGYAIQKISPNGSTHVPNLGSGR